MYIASFAGSVGHPTYLDFVPAHAETSPLGRAPRACSTTLIAVFATCLLLECALLLRLGFQIRGSFVKGESRSPAYGAAP